MWSFNEKQNLIYPVSIDMSDSSRRDSSLPCSLDVVLLKNLALSLSYIDELLIKRRCKMASDPAGALKSSKIQ